MDFEKALKEFEENIQKLSNSDLSIEEAIFLHEECLKKCKVCEDILNDASQKIDVYKRKQEEENV